jgi:hypothetical protein
MIKMLEVKVGQYWTPAPNYFMSLIRVRDIFTLKYPEYWIFVGLECVKCHKLCSQRCEVL